MSFTSLCIMSYERPRFLEDSMTSLAYTVDERHEVIVHDDASTNPRVQKYLFDEFSKGMISKLIMNNGKNRGIARSVHTAFDLAEGEYIYKLDGDLIYEPHWLSTTNNILRKHKDVIMVGLFNYQHYDPQDKRFVILEERSDCFIVNDFVSSGFGFHHSVYGQFGKALGADGWHLYLRDKGFKLAIPKVDVAKNVGFGIGRSTYVYEKDGKVLAKGFHNEPYLLGT